MSRRPRVAAADTTVRRAAPEDADAIRAVHRAAVRGLRAAGRYTPEQIAAWSGERRPEDYRRAMTAGGGEIVFVAERRQDGRIVGFASLRGAEVVAVYVAPGSQGKGTGAALLRAVEREAAAGGVDRLHLSASLNAVPFYEALGYCRRHARTFFLPGGVELAAVGMEKPLRL